MATLTMTPVARSTLLYSLETLLSRCTVKVIIPGGHGTGFFVAPGLILTCRHVVQAMLPPATPETVPGDSMPATSVAVPVHWLCQDQHYTAVLKQLPDDPTCDLVLLALLEPPLDHGCVWLDPSIQSGDRLYTYGYPDDAPEGSPATFEAEGITGGVPFIKFKAGQVRPGLSGAPLLNWRTGKVCGLVKYTHDRTSALGGGAIPGGVLYQQFPELIPLQQQIQQRDQQWSAALGQRVVDDTILLQTMGGAIVHRLGNDQQPQITPCRPQFHLRSTFPGLLDRRDERQQVVTALQQHLSIEVSSPQGCGKTTFLEYVADLAQLLALFPDGIVFHRVGQQALVYDLVQELHDRLYTSTLPIKATAAYIHSHLQHRQALIVLDDVPFSQSDLQELLVAIPRCTLVLATPKRQLVGQTVCGIALGGLPLEDALVLLERGLGRALSPMEHPVAESLCQVLQGHPGNLLLWAGRVNQQRPLATVLQQAQSEVMTGQILTFLQTNQRWIVVLLAAIGGVALLAEQAAALTNIPDTEAVLGGLVQGNLVQREGDRYRLDRAIVETLQQHNLQPWRQKSLQAFKTWASQHQQDTAWLLENQEPLMYLIKWAVQQADWRSVLALVQPLEGALASSGRWGAWVQVLKWGLQAAKALQDSATESWMLHQLGTHALCLRAASVAQQNLEQALRLRQTLGDTVGVAVTQHNLGLLGVVPNTYDQTIPSTQRRFRGVFTSAILLSAVGVWLAIWLRPRLVPTPLQPGLSSLNPTSPNLSSNQPFPTPLVKVTNVTATAASSAEIRLRWTVSTAEVGLRAERSTDAGKTFQAIATLKPGSTRYDDKSLKPATTYHYRICTRDNLSNRTAANSPKPVCSGVVSATTKPKPLPSLTIQQFTLTVTQVQGGQALRGNVVLNQPAPSSGVTIDLSRDYPGVVILPATLEIPVGKTSGEVAIRTTSVTRATPVTIVASYQNSQRSAVVTVNPAPITPLTPQVRLRGLTLGDRSVVGGTSTEGTVTLDSPAPAGGIAVQLRSSDPELVIVPATVQVSRGESAASFKITTRQVSQSAIVQISATSREQGSAQVSLQLTAVQPPPPPDLSATAIEFELLEQNSPFEGVVRIVGTVSNLGQGRFIATDGQTVILQEVYPGGKSQDVEEISLRSLAPGETITIDYTRPWSVADEFPPSYRLVIIAEDANSNNNAIARDGQAINQLFSRSDR